MHCSYFPFVLREFDFLFPVFVHVNEIFMLTTDDRIPFHVLPAADLAGAGVHRLGALEHDHAGAWWTFAL